MTTPPYRQAQLILLIDETNSYVAAAKTLGINLYTAYNIVKGLEKRYRCDFVTVNPYGKGLKRELVVSEFGMKWAKRNHTRTRARWLSPQQERVLKLAGQGACKKEMGEVLGVSGKVALQYLRKAQGRVKNVPR